MRKAERRVDGKNIKNHVCEAGNAISIVAKWNNHFLQPETGRETIEQELQQMAKTDRKKSNVTLIDTITT